MAVSGNPPFVFCCAIIVKVLLNSDTFWYVLPLVLCFVIRSDTFRKSSGTFLPVFVHAWCFCGTFWYVPEQFRYVLPWLSLDLMIMWYVLVRSVRRLCKLHKYVLWYFLVRSTKVLVRSMQPFRVFWKVGFHLPQVLTDRLPFQYVLPCFLFNGFVCAVRSIGFWLRSIAIFPAIHWNKTFIGTFYWVLFNSIANSTHFK